MNRKFAHANAVYSHEASSRIHIGRHFPHQHDLRTAIAGRFEQHRIHTRIWRDPRGFRLKNLPPISLPSA